MGTSLVQWVLTLLMGTSLVQWVLTLLTDTSLVQWVLTLLIGTSLVQWVLTLLNGTSLVQWVLTLLIGTSLVQWVLTLLNGTSLVHWVLTLLMGTSLVHRILLSLVLPTRTGIMWLRNRLRTTVSSYNITLKGYRCAMQQQRKAQSRMLNSNPLIALCFRPNWSEINQQFHLTLKSIIEHFTLVEISRFSALSVNHIFTLT